MLLPPVTVFPVTMTGGRPEGGSGYIKDHHKQREEEDYSKLLQGSVIITAAEAAARICK